MGLDSAGTMQTEDTGWGSLGYFYVEVSGSGIESEGHYEGCCSRPHSSLPPISRTLNPKP